MVVGGGGEWCIRELYTNTCAFIPPNGGILTERKEGGAREYLIGRVVRREQERGGDISVYSTEVCIKVPRYVPVSRAGMFLYVRYLYLGGYMHSRYILCMYLQSFSVSVNPALHNVLYITLYSYVCMYLCYA